MILSDKFDSFMEFKKLARKGINFIINRFIELLGALVALFSIVLLVSLLSYSPEDPNFIFPENQEIKNLLGFK